MAQTGFSVVSNAAELESVREQSTPLAVMQPGQQSDLMRRYEFEIFIGGEKGTGKTRASIVWLIRGNLDVPDDKKTPTDIFYFNNPLFRAAVIRKNIDDLNSWVEDAKRVYGTEGDLLGATYTTQPREFTWKHSGAKIFCTHMQDANAYMRLTGQSLVRLFWDELPFEPDKDVYDQVYSCVRSPDVRMRAQILAAGNPIGPGLTWVKERFVRFRNEEGVLYQSGETMRIPIIDPKTKQRKFITRLFVHWTMDGNPAFTEVDPDYQARLYAGISNPSLRQALVFGDWDAAGGKFFEFRRKPRGDEPANACHIYDASKQVIQPWWPRIIGFDWGFSHYLCAIKIALSPDGRVWVVDEFVHKGVGSRESGAALARWCVSDMAGLKACGVMPVIPVFISPDAIDQRRDDYGTIAENIVEGIMSVFGPGSSEILDKEDANSDDFALRRMLQYSAKMPLRRATNKRHAGWDTMRELMQWESLAEPDLAQYSEDHAQRMLDKGADYYFKYQMEFVKKREALPRMQLSSRLRYLPDALESAVSSISDLEDIQPPSRGNKDIVQLQDDMRDAARYGFHAVNLYRQITTPVGVRVQSALSEYPNMTEEQRFQATPVLTKSFEKKQIKGFSIRRGPSGGVFVQ